jgi:DNA-binding transcriptional MerR regulator
MRLTISKAPREAGLSADTLRYYEREDLIPPPDRSPSGYRRYPETIVERLRLIKGAQRVGLRLREIRELLDARDRGLCPCGHTEATIRERIAEVDRETERLGEVRAELARMPEQLPDACEDSSGAPWPMRRRSSRSERGCPDAWSVSELRLPLWAAPLPVLREPVAPSVEEEEPVNESSLPAATLSERFARQRLLRWPSPREGS